MEETVIYNLKVGDRFAFKDKNNGAFKKFKVMNFEQATSDGKTTIIYQNLENGLISRLSYERNNPGEEPIRVVKI